MLPYRTRRRLALLILLVGMPLWIVLSVSAVNWMDARFGRQPFWIEVSIYVALGLVWILPFRSIFRGVGKADPEAQKPDDPDR